MYALERNELVLSANDSRTMGMWMKAIARAAELTVTGRISLTSSPQDSGSSKISRTISSGHDPSLLAMLSRSASSSSLTSVGSKESNSADLSNPEEPPEISAPITVTHNRSIEITVYENEVRSAVPPFAFIPCSRRFTLDINKKQKSNYDPPGNCAPPDGCKWTSPWREDRTYTQTDDKGWTYALNFMRLNSNLLQKTSYTSGTGCAVRRKKWVRTAVPVSPVVPHQRLSGIAPAPRPHSQMIEQGVYTIDETREGCNETPKESDDASIESATVDLGEGDGDGEGRKKKKGPPPTAPPSSPPPMPPLPSLTPTPSDEPQSPPHGNKSQSSPARTSPDPREHQSHRRVSFISSNTQGQDLMFQGQLIMRDDISVEATPLVGKSSVFRGEWRGSPVAVKMIKCDEESMPSLDAELALMSTIHHPRLLTLMGVCREMEPTEGSVALVTEYMDHGSLYFVLHGTSSKAQSYRPKTMAARLRLAADVANGIRFLHRSNLLHGCFKSTNVLVDEDGRAKVSGFGLNSFRDRMMSSAVDDQGTVVAAWIAPELMTGASMEESTDVYSFGVVLWEIITGEIPWGKVSADEIFACVGQQGDRLPIPAVSESCPAAVCGVLETCFGPPQARPTFDDLFQTLNVILQDVESRSVDPGSSGGPADGADMMGGGALTPRTMDAGVLPNGRTPSMRTMALQWHFMRTKFLKGEDDEIEWLMVSKEPGAYKYAHKKYNEAEDEYYRTLFLVSVGEANMEQLKAPIAKLVTLLTMKVKMDADLSDMSSASEHLEAASATILNAQAKVAELLATSVQPLTSNDSVKFISVFSDRGQKILQSFLMSEHAMEICSIAESLLKVWVPKEKNFMKEYMINIQKESEVALKEMERWGQREKDADDYAVVMRKEEEQWFRTEERANRAALEEMRSYVPVNIATLSLDALRTEVVDRSGLFTDDLLFELRKNKLLQWMVMHPDDIAYANFLLGEVKQFFENLEMYDIVELRALALCVPEKFEIDSDGKKMAWRDRLIARVKTLSQQQAGMIIKGGWDPSINRRADVQLPPLKREQLRRAVYFYGEKKVYNTKLKQMNDKHALRLKKEALLVDAEAAAKEAKIEYDIVLQEMRDPDFKEQFGVEQLAKIKDMAKDELQAAERKVKEIKADVARLVKAESEAPVSREMFSQRIEEIDRFIAAKGFNWTTSTVPIPIDGVFDRRPTVAKQIKAATKFVTAEEEAEMRKAEMAALRAQKPSEEEASPSSTPVSSLAEASPVQRRGSVFASVNPSLLEKMSSQVGRRASTMSPGTDTPRSGMRPDKPKGDIASSGNPSEKEKEKVVKQSKSKLLQKLCKGVDDAMNAASNVMHGHAVAATGGPPMSFLDQLKQKKGGGGGEGGGGGGPPISFLDQLKQKKGGGAGGGGGPPMSFLDQIKQKKEKSGAGASSESGAESGAGAKKAAPISFLDAIKARKVE